MEEQTFIAKNLDIFIGIIATIISVYIPVGIVFLQDIGKDNKTFKEFDIRIIKEKLIDLKHIIICIILYFILLLLGNDYLRLFSQQIILMIAIIILFSMICYSLLQIYKWFSYTGKNQIRYEQLCIIEDYEIRNQLFKSTREKKDGEIIIKSFFKVLNNSKNRVLISNMLQLFLGYGCNNKVYQEMFIEKYGDFNSFSMFLNLYFKTWSIEQDIDPKDHGREIVTIIRIFKEQFLLLNKKNHYYLTYLINEHFKICSISDYKYELLQDLLEIFLSCEELLSDNDFIETLTQEFPIYQIDINNYNLNEKIFFTEQILDYLIKNVQKYNNIEEYDLKYKIYIDNIIEYFFPGTEIITYATLLTFYFCSVDQNNNVYEYSKYKRDFGHMGKVYSGFGENIQDTLEEIRQAEEDYTIKFFIKVFKNKVKRDDIDKYLIDIDVLLNNNHTSDNEKSRIRSLSYYLKKLKNL